MLSSYLSLWCEHYSSDRKERRRRNNNWQYLEDDHFAREVAIRVCLLLGCNVGRHYHSVGPISSLLSLF